MTTLPTGENVANFIAAVPDDARRADAEKLSGLLAEWTGEPATMWGTSIVGFAPRKTALVVYLAGGAHERDAQLLERLGPHKLGKGCLYLKRLDDADRRTS